MASESAGEPDIPTHLKDSCTYSVEVAKQFLTFAAGGIAFLVATALAPATRVSPLFYWSFSSFILSVLLGLAYIMQVVGHIHHDKNYDVYSIRLRACSALQLLSSIVGAVVLGVIVFRLLPERNSVPATSNGVVEVRTATQQVRYALPLGATLSLKTNEKGEIDCRTEQRPSK